MKLSEMTDEAKRVAIAEACGWEYTYGPCSDNGYPWKSADDIHHASPPKYLTSLDAMHEAEKTLGRDAHAYVEALFDLIIETEEDDTIRDRDLRWCCATAAQRADAFLLAKNIATS